MPTARRTRFREVPGGCRGPFRASFRYALTTVPRWGLYRGPLRGRLAYDAERIASLSMNLFQPRRQECTSSLRGIGLPHTRRFVAEGA